MIKSILLKKFKNRRTKYFSWCLAAIFLMTTIIQFPIPVSADTVYDFGYTGNYQTFTAPVTGTYILEVWGAEGGRRGGTSNYSGKGGYASGQITLNAGTVLYIYVGGKGTNSYSYIDGHDGMLFAGGWNGGGNGSGTRGPGGGGATDIRLGGTGLGNRIIVAGGGGGGGTGNDYTNGGYTTSSGYLYQLGQGESGCSSRHASSWENDEGGGGGGYYGGRTIHGDDPSAGYGGSSYTGGVQNGVTIKGVRTENGFARITQLNSSPVIESLSSPVAGNTYMKQDRLTVSGNVKDDKAGSVEIFYRIKNSSNSVVIGDTKLGNISVSANTSTGFNFTGTSGVNLSAISTSGQYTIEVWAKDSEGGIGTAFSRTFNVNVNRPPVISLSTPTTNLTVTEISGSNTITFRGKVSDPDANSVTISAVIGGVTKSTTLTAPTSTPGSDNWTLTWNVVTDNIAEGTYSNIAVNVTDGKGGTASTSYTHTITVDKTSPLVVNTNPGTDATGISRNTTITVYFSEAVVQSTNFNQIALTCDSGAVSISRTLSGSTLSIVPSTLLKSGTRYTVKIPVSSVKDAFGHNISGEYTFSFTTIGPGVINTSPYNGQTNVPVENLNIVITFNTNIQIGNSSAYNSITIRDGSGKPIPFTSQIAGNQLTLTPTPGTIEESTAYTVTLPINSIKDFSENYLAQESKFTFTSSNDTQKPQILNVTPGSGNITKNTTVTFDVTDNIGIGTVEYAWTNGIVETYASAIKVSGTSKNARYRTTAPPPGYEQLKIRVTDVSGNIQERNVQYNYALQSIAITPSYKNMLFTNASGGTVAVIAYFTDGTSTNITSLSTISKLTYTTTDQNVAYIQNNVLWSGSTTGTAYITAKYKDKEATCEVNVSGSKGDDQEKPKIISVSKNEQEEIDKNTVVQFRVTDNKRIVSVQYMWTNGMVDVNNGVAGEYIPATVVTTVTAGTDIIYRAGTPPDGCTRLWLKAIDATDNMETMMLEYIRTPISLTIEPASKTIIGLRASGGALSVTANYSDGTRADISDYFNTDALQKLTYETKNNMTTIAYVENGVLYSGVITGTAQIIAKYGYVDKNGGSHYVTGTCNVTVLPKDTIPPKITLTTPANGQVGVNFVPRDNFYINVYFNESIEYDPDAAKITLRGPSGIINTNVFANGNSLRISASGQSIQGNKQYTVTIPNISVKDMERNSMAANAVIQFTTAAAALDVTGPVIIKYDPGYNQKVLVTTATATKTISFQFDEEIVAGDKFNEIKVKRVLPNGGEADVTFTKVIDKDTLKITLTLQTNSKYHVIIPGPGTKPEYKAGNNAAIKDKSGNSFLGM